MSLKIIKAGILDTIQDGGRYGYQHLGINPGGAMDKFSFRLSNALLGKDLDSPVIEMHFPAPKISFEADTVICITGGDFSPTIEQKRVPIAQPILVKHNSILQFEKLVSGARCYLSVLEDVKIEKWLSSYSTNLKAEAGGLNGKALRKNDVLEFCKPIVLNEKGALHWKVQQQIFQNRTIRFLKGNEWDWLSDESKNLLENSSFKISNTSDRMGYRLTGEALNVKHNTSMISSPVTFGTVQLLPDGQLIILMADHQTTGGYPRIANVISADLPLLAQKTPGEKIIFSSAELNVAEEELLAQQKYLQQLQASCKFNVEKLLNVTL